MLPQGLTTISVGLAGIRFEWIPLRVKPGNGRLTIIDSYYLSKGPVTWKQWRVVMFDELEFTPGNSDPVVGLTADKKNSFIRKLNQRAERNGRYNYRLAKPTEVETSGKVGDGFWVVANEKPRLDFFGSQSQKRTSNPRF